MYLDLDLCCPLVPPGALMDHAHLPECTPLTQWCSRGETCCNWQLFWSVWSCLPVALDRRVSYSLTKLAPRRTQHAPSPKGTLPLSSLNSAVAPQTSACPLLAWREYELGELNSLVPPWEDLELWHVHLVPLPLLQVLPLPLLDNWS